MSRPPLDIVVLGGSFAGLSVARHILDHTIGQLGTFEYAPAYRVVLVSPSTHLYWNICAPKALVSEDSISVHDAFIAIQPAFSRYPAERFTFVQGSAVAIDTSARTVTIKPTPIDNTKRLPSTSITTVSSVSTASARQLPISGTDNRNQVLPYHALILATGSSSRSPLYSLHGSHEDTVAELRVFHARLDSAESVRIVGGGPTGVETAGQLATYFNRRRQSCKLQGSSCPASHPSEKTIPRRRLRKRHWLRVDESSSMTYPAVTTSSRTRKAISIVSGSDRLLPKLHPVVSAKAEKQLKALGVEILHYCRQIGSTIGVDGKTTCILNNGTKLSTDVLIEATGVVPNTAFLPQRMLDERGYVKTSPEDLRVTGQEIGKRVYAIGDCANYSRNCIFDVYDAVPALAQNLLNDLLAHEYKMRTQLLVYRASSALSKVDSVMKSPLSPTSSLSLKNGASDAPTYLPSAYLSPAEAASMIERLEDARFNQSQTDSQLMPISRRGGVGVLFDISLPSWLVHLLKGKDYRMGKTEKTVYEGRNPYSMR